MPTFNGLGADRNWFNQLNWSNADVPTSATRVEINPVFGNQPEITLLAAQAAGATEARALDVLIEGGNSLTVRSSVVLRVVADVRVGGGLNDQLIIGSAGRVESDAAGVFFRVGVDSSSFGKITIGAAVGALNAASAGTLAENVQLEGFFSSFEFNALGAATHSNIIAGLGKLIVHQGTAILTGANTYSGITQTAGGSTLQVGNGGSTGTIGTGTVVNNGTLAFNQTGTHLVSNLIEGGGNVTFAGGGSFVLFGENTYSGGTSIAAGTQLRSGNGGTTGTLGTGGVANDGSLIFGQVELTFVGNSISGSGTVTFAFGKHVLTGNNTYSGGTTINAGATVQVGAGGSGGGIGTGTITNNGSLEFFKTGAYTHSNTIAGTGGLTVYSGTLTLDGHVSSPNTFSGGVFLSASNSPTLKAGKVNAFGTGNVTVSTGSTLELAGFSQTVDSIQGAGSISSSSTRDATLTIAGAIPVNSVFSGVISDAAAVLGGALSIRKSGAGSLVLTGNNSYFGTTTVTNGILQVGDGGTTGSLGHGAVSFATILQFNRSNTVTVSNDIASSSGRVELGNGVTTGTYVFLGTNTYDQTLITTGSTLQIGQAGSSTGTLGVGNVINNGLLIFDRDMIVANQISGTGNVTISADVTFTGTNSYKQTTITNGNTLFIGNWMDVLQPPGTLGSGRVNIEGNAKLVFQRSGADITVNNELTGTGKVEVTWGTVTLANTNSYSGGTLVSGADLNAGAQNAFGTGLFEAYSASIDLKGYSQTVAGIAGGTGGVIINNSASAAAVTLILNGGQTNTFAGVITDSGASLGLTVAGAATKQILTGVNTYSGSTTITEGILGLSGAGSIADSSEVVLSNGGTFDISGTTAVATVKDLYVSGDSGTVALGARSLTVTGLLGDTGAITFTGGMGVNALSFTLADTIGGASLGAALFNNWTAGTDTITLNGNATNNTLIGTSQADTINGLEGNDILDGGPGLDRLDGGGGLDSISYASTGTGAGILFYLLAPHLNGGDALGSDIYTSIEGVVGTSANDRMYMDNNDNAVDGVGGVFDSAELYAGADTYDGGSGFDYVLGGAGNDIINVGNGGSLIYGEGDDDIIIASSGSNSLYGGAGIDTLTGGTGQDVIFGGTEGDTLNGSDGDDFLFGEDGVDTINGGAGNDQIQGGADNDFINGEADVDVILGGAGSDSISGETENDFLYGEGGDDIIFGGEGNDEIGGGSDEDNLFGNAGFDILKGDDGNDYLDGGRGDDTNPTIVNFLIGGTGNDRLISSASQEQMWGNSGVIGASDTGADSFEFEANNGFDIIFDFQAGVGIGDVIGVFGTSITSFAQLLSENRIGQAGTYTQINLPGVGNQIFLANVTATNLVADDFIFG